MYHSAWAQSPIPEPAGRDLNQKAVITIDVQIQPPTRAGWIKMCTKESLRLKI